MPRHRTDLEKAAGLLISAVQKEWGAELGETGAAVSETVMSNCHALLRAAKTHGGLTRELRGASIADYLGRAWVRRHPNVLPTIESLEGLLADDDMPHDSLEPSPQQGGA